MELHEIPECLYGRLVRGLRNPDVKSLVHPSGITGELLARPTYPAWVALLTTPPATLPGPHRLRAELIVYIDQVSAESLSATDRLLTVLVHDVGPLDELERRLELQSGNVTLQVNGGNRLLALAAEILHDTDMFARTVATTRRSVAS